jgi:hypothetical protein
MRNGQVTPVTAPHVEPVVYIDLDIVPANHDELADDVTAAEMCGITAYPGLRALLLTEHGPAGGQPVYRIEGPIGQLVKWLTGQYSADASDGESLAFHLDHVYLAQ